MPVYAQNRQARREWVIEEELEAGLVLSGHEVKAVRAGKMDLTGSVVTPHENSLYLTNATIAPYQPRNVPAGYNPRRPRRLLLHREEIKKILGRRKGARLTLVPLRVYTKGARIKLALGLGRRRKRKDRRKEEARRREEQELRRMLKEGGF
jgi:SsrA-binding protein